MDSWKKEDIVKRRKDIFDSISSYLNGSWEKTFNNKK